MKLTENKIKKLWKWFKNHEKQIRECMEKESGSDRDFIVEQLDNLILDMGIFSWEIRPGVSKNWSLIISPNGDKELLRKSKKIMHKAPIHEEWEFHYCRPALNWDRQLLIYDSFMDEQQINASNWKYVVVPLKEEKFKLILEANNINHLDRETALKAAHMTVVNEIGEETKIHSVSSIDIVDQLKQEHKSSKSDILKLKDQFLKIRKL